MSSMVQSALIASDERHSRHWGVGGHLFPCLIDPAAGIGRAGWLAGWLEIKAPADAHESNSSGLFLKRGLVAMTDDAKPLGVVNASQPRKIRQRLKKGSHPGLLK